MEIHYTIAFYRKCRESANSAMAVKTIPGNSIFLAK
jgi:hypothetical protein